ncbi:hypothetical protein M15_13650 [Atrimonas thermophila]
MAVKLAVNQGQPQGFLPKFRGQKGFSFIEIVIVIAVLALSVTSFSLLFWNNVVTKTANENLIAASAVAENVLEHVKKVSIDNFSALTSFIENNDNGNNDINDEAGILELNLNSSSFLNTFYQDESGLLSETLATLPSAGELSYIHLEIKETNEINGNIEKVLVKATIRWTEIARPQSSEKTRQYTLVSYISRYGVGSFL